MGPRYLERVTLDNAALLARRVYLTDLPLFDAVYAREKGDLRAAMRRIVELAKARPKDPYGALRDWIGTGADQVNRPRSSARRSSRGCGGAGGVSAGSGAGGPRTTRSMCSRTPRSRKRESWSIE